MGALLPWVFQEKLTEIVYFGDWIFLPSQGALWGLLLALSAVIGDLIASVLKRLASMKDSGGAIPGIGGLFDLTDSLILAAPTGYFILFFLQKRIILRSLYFWVPPVPLERAP